MTVLLALLADYWPAIIALVGAAGLYLKGRSDGGSKAASKQAARDRLAMEERLEMNREASEFERRAAGMSDQDLDRRITR